MRFKKVNMKHNTMKNSKSEMGVDKNVSHCASHESAFSEIRKSLDILEDVFSDLSDKEDSPGTKGDIHTGKEGPKGHNPVTASEMLQLLSKGGITPKDLPLPETNVDISEDITGCSTSSSEALLQLVHTDHPYLCKSQDADDNEAPAKSGSCSSIPDPEILNDFFLHTTNMISYQPIGGVPEVEGVPVPSPAPTLIGSPHLTSKTNPDPKCPLLGDSSECSGYRAEGGEKSNETLNPKVPLSEESGKSEKEDDKRFQGSIVPSSARDSDKTEELKHAESSVKNTDDDSETKRVPTKENPTDLQGNMKAYNSKEVDEAEQSKYDPETKPDVYKNLQADESSVFSNMVKPSSLNQIDPNSWTAACKAMADKVQEESLIHCAVSLLLKVWTDYLSLTFEEVRAREIQTAKESNYTDDVIAMIEDKDRYVWQLIEEMEPRNFMIDF